MSVRVEQQGWWRRRGVGVLLALAVELLLLLALLSIGGRRVPQFTGHGDKTFELFNAAEDKRAAAAAKSPERAQVQKRTAAPKPERTARENPPPPVPDETPPPLVNVPGMITLSREAFAASDIGRIKRAERAAGGGAGPAAGDDSEAVGTAPNGEPLYAAEWYREPRDAELQPYLAKARNTAGGWGLIACQTAARYHVENCQVLGESPPGSNLGYQVREAAWQFLVIPPRKGGQAMMGAWVRIRITLRER